MKKFNKFLAMLLCAVMIVGAVSFAISDVNNVTAVSPTDNDAQGVVQGPNDGVLIVTGNVSFANIAKYVAANKINGNGIGGSSSGQSFDRVIVLFAYSKAMSSESAAFKDANLTGNENIVWTHKCTLSNVDQVWEIKDNTNAPSKTSRSADLINHYDGASTNHKFTHASASGKFMRWGCNVEWNYFNAHFPSVDSLIYCDGRNFTVGEDVNFTYGADSAGYRPIIVNGTYFSKTNPESVNLNQTIKLLGGEYRYIAPRSRVVDSKTVVSGTINVVLGKIKVVGKMANSQPCQNAIMAYDSHSGVVINYTVNGAHFENPLYILGGKEIDTTTSGPEHAGTINLTINDGYFAQGIIASYDSTNDDTHAPSTVSPNKLYVNVTVNNFRGNGTIDIEGGDNEDIVSTVLYNERFVAPSLILNSNTCEPIAAAPNCGVGNHVYIVHFDGEIPLHVCSICGENNSDFKLNNGAPVVFVDSVNGSDKTTGLTAGSAFRYLTEAFEKLAEWGVGGTVVISGPSITKSNTTLVDAGGEVVITSKLGEDDYRLSADACFVFVHYVKFFNDIEFDCLNILRTSSPKTIFLNFNDFVVTENCAFYVNQGSHTLAEPPATKNVNNPTPVKTDECKITVITGARFADAATEGKDVIFGTQRINLEAGNWFRIAVGSKTHTDGVYHDAENSGSTGCEGNVIVKIGKEASVLAVDTVTSQQNSINVDVVFEDRTDFEFKTGNVAPTAEKVGVYVGTEATEEIVAVVDSDFFGYEGVQHKVAVDGYGDVGVRATYTIDKDADTNGVVEFGTLITPQVDYETYGIGYIRSTAYYGVDTLNTNNLYLGNIAKSLAYLQNKEQVKADVANYELAAGQENATFRGTLVFDGATASNVNAIFAFAPYAVVKGNGGNYAVIGTVTENVTLNPNNP